MVLEPATTPGSWQPNVGAWLQYAHAPVRLKLPGTGDELRAVGHMLAADVVAGLGLGDRAALGLDLPVLLWQDGTTPAPEGFVTGGAVPATGVGDLALHGKATVVSNDRQGVHTGFGLAAIGVVTFPTGDRKSFMGEGALTVSLEALVEYALGVGALRATLGYMLRTEQRTLPALGSAAPPAGSPPGVTFGDEIPWSIGLALRPKVIAPALDGGDRQLWELALHGSLPAGPVAPLGLGASGASLLSPVLVAADDRVALGHSRDAYVMLGAELGLGDAYGTPLARAVVSLGWAPRRHDRDDDGVPDDADECPDLPEDRDGIQDADGCPEDDADGDGVPDTDDACPLVPGPPQPDRRKNGCPEAK